MSKPLITIHNTQTNEIITREMNADEFAQYNLDEKAKRERDAAQAAKDADKAALLVKLGITAEEATLLLS
jgi:hypothetical protein